MFHIEDEMHADLDGPYPSLEAAVSALRNIVTGRWDEPPLRPPCGGWRDCHRIYVVVDYDEGASPWRENRRWEVVTVTGEGPTWEPDFGGP
jgi:hypothetical protein